MLCNLELFTRGTKLLKRTRKGVLHWKMVSVYIHRMGQVMLKMKSRHVAGTITKKKKSESSKNFPSSVTSVLSLGYARIWQHGQASTCWRGESSDGTLGFGLLIVGWWNSIAGVSGSTRCLLRVCHACSSSSMGGRSCDGERKAIEQYAHC